MSISVRSPLHRQVERVWRRLLVQIFINRLVWCLTGAFIVAVVCILLQPFLLPTKPGESSTWLRVEVAAGLAGAGVLLAIGLTWWRAPSRLTAALLLDEKFGLRERVTTSLTLTAEQQALPMGQALLADIDQRITRLSVRTGIGIRVPWTAALVPVTLLALAMATAFYPGSMRAETGKTTPFTKAPAVAPDVKTELDDIKKDAKQDREKQANRAANAPEEGQFEEFDELEKIISAPRETEDQLRERMKEMTDLDDRLAKKLKDLENKEKTQQEQLDRLSKKQKKDGPAKELQDALSRSDFDKARQEAERLGKELESGQLSEEERSQLKEQLEDLEKELERLSRDEIEEAEQKLDEQFKEGEIEQETLDREMDQLKQKKEDLKELEELAKDLEECDKCLGEGDQAQAAARMKKVASKLKKMGAGKQGKEDLAKLSRQARQAKNAMGGGIGRGSRPESPEAETKAENARSSTPSDPKGQKRVVGHGPPGKNFKPKSSEEMSKEIREAAQDAPEALKRQRIPKAASDIAKGYFENIGGQTDKEKKKP